MPADGSEPTGQETVQEGLQEESVMGEVEFSELQPSTGEPEGQGQKPETPPEGAQIAARDPATGRFIEAQKEGETPPEGQKPEGEAASPQTDAKGEPQEPPEYPEWTFQADQTQYAVPGSKQGDQGIFIPNEQIPWLQQQLATAYAHKGSWQRELAGAQAAGQQMMQQAQAVQAQADYIVQQIQALAEGDEEAAWAWFQDYRQNLQTLLAGAEREQLQAERQVMQQAQQIQTQQQVVQQIYQQQNQALVNAVQGYSQLDQFKGVDAQRILQRLDGLRSSIFYSAPTDAPDGSYRRGDILVNYGIIEQEFQTHADYMAQAGNVDKAAAANQAALQKGTTPPAVPAAGGAVGKAKSGMPKFKTEQEMNDWLESTAADKWAVDQLQAS